MKQVAPASRKLWLPTVTPTPNCYLRLFTVHTFFGIYTALRQAILSIEAICHNIHSAVVLCSIHFAYTYKCVHNQVIGSKRKWSQNSSGNYLNHPIHCLDCAFTDFIALTPSRATSTSIAPCATIN